MSFNLEIFTPLKVVFKGSVKSVTIPGTEGSFQVLQNHAPLISNFTVGMIKIETESGLNEYSTGGGVFEVKKNDAVIIAQSVESKADIDLRRAKLSKERAEAVLKDPKATHVQLEDARETLHRAVNRIRIIENK